MSVRAYKIIEIKTEKEPSFNCWNDEEIMAIADQTQYDDGGIIQIQQDEAEELMAELLEQEGEQSDHIKKVIDNLKKVIKDCKKNGGDIEYLCY